MAAVTDRLRIDHLRQCCVQVVLVQWTSPLALIRIIPLMPSGQRPCHRPVHRQGAEMLTPLCKLAGSETTVQRDCLLRLGSEACHPFPMDLHREQQVDEDRPSIETYAHQHRLCIHRHWGLFESVSPWVIAELHLVDQATPRPLQVSRMILRHRRLLARAMRPRRRQNP